MPTCLWQVLKIQLWPCLAMPDKRMDAVNDVYRWSGYISSWWASPLIAPLIRWSAWAPITRITPEMHQIASVHPSREFWPPLATSCQHLYDIDPPLLLTLWLLNLKWFSLNTLKLYSENPAYGIQRWENDNFLNVKINLHAVVSFPFAELVFLCFVCLRRDVMTGSDLRWQKLYYHLL